MVSRNIERPLEESWIIPSKVLEKSSGYYILACDLSSAFGHYSLDEFDKKVLNFRLTHLSGDV